MDAKFEGWVGLDPTAAEGHMVWRSFEPKPWEETDVDIKVTHSSICGTDVHILRNGWVRGPFRHLSQMSLYEENLLITLCFF